MKNKVINKNLEIHTTPLEKLILDTYKIDIELDDINEKRYKIKVNPYQAIKIVTIDCVSSKDYFNEYCFREGRYHRHILEIEDSKWIEELKQSLTDKTATFLNDVKHFVLPLQDIVIEFVAKEFFISEV
jgi:hypothetical protein